MNTTEIGANGKDSNLLLQAGSLPCCQVSTLRPRQISSPYKGEPPKELAVLPTVHRGGPRNGGCSTIAASSIQSNSFGSSVAAPVKFVWRANCFNLTQITGSRESGSKEGNRQSQPHSADFMVAGVGFEPTTFWLWARRAIRAAPPRNPNIQKSKALFPTHERPVPHRSLTYIHSTTLLHIVKRGQSARLHRLS